MRRPALGKSNGPPDELRFRAEAGLPITELAARLAGLAVTEERPGEYRVEGAIVPNLVAAVTGWLAERGALLAELHVGRQSLEDVYLRLTDNGNGRPVRPLAGEYANVRETTASLTSAPLLGMPVAGQAQAPASLAAMILAQTVAELRLALRRGESVLITLIIPPALLVFFGLVDLMPIPPDRRAEFLVPGILALAIMSTAMVSTGSRPRSSGTKGVKRLGVSPLPRGGLLAAKIASILVIELLQTVLIVGVAASVLGWRPTGSLMAVSIALVLGTAAFGGLGLLMAGTLRAEATLAVANGLYLVFLLLGGIVFPTSHLGPWLTGPAALLPSTALAETLRSALGASGRRLADQLDRAVHLGDLCARGGDAHVSVGMSACSGDWK